MDTAGRIAFLFGSLSLILFGLCLIMTLKNKRRNKEHFYIEIWEIYKFLEKGLYF